MQSSCIGSLMEIANNDKNVLYLTADSGEGGLDLMFRHNFPDRTFDFGIAEENMVAAAAGLATAGKIPFVYTASPFLAYRSYEFIRNDVCLQNLPVKLIGTGSGISVSSLGPTHHATEDICCLRCLPNLTILSPSTPRQAYAAMEYAYQINGPVYIRLGMSREKEFYEDGYQFSDSGMDCLCEGDDAIFFSTGGILETVMNVAEELRSDGISASVVDVSMLKPFDIMTAQKYINNTGSIVCTVEEHNVIGGLGSIVAETMLCVGERKKFLKIGLNDTFAKGYGSLHQLRIENGLDGQSIKSRILKLINE